MGQTTMTLDDVRAFNKTRNTTYEINKNDCRHYVNDLSRLATGWAWASLCPFLHLHLRRSSVALLPLYTLK
jgi:hypothetical protein